MGRFDQLELPGKKPFSKDPQAEGALIYDAKRFLQMAEDAYWNGNYEASLRYYSKVLGENPGEVNAWLGQVMCLLRLSEFKEALIWLDKALDKFPQAGDLLAAKAIVHSRLKDKQTAMDFSDAALNIKSNSVFPWIARGDVLLKSNPQNARRCLEKAMESAGADNWKILVRIADTFKENKHFRNALHFYLKAAEIVPDNSRIWLMIGDCRYSLGMNNYIHAYQQAAEIRPTWNEVRKRLINKRPGLLKRLFQRMSCGMK